MRALLLCVLLECATVNAPSKAQTAGEPASAAVKVGDRAPEVAPGKVTLIVFWATWSEPSKVMSARLEEIWRRKKDRAFTMRAVSIDDEPTYVGTWKETYGFTFPVEWDENRRMTTLYHPRSSDCVYVIDRAGIVRFVHFGYHDGEDKEIEAEVDSLL